MTMAARTFDQMSRAELIAELRRRVTAGREADVRRALQELETYREEIGAQHDELVAVRSLLELSRDRYEDLFDFAPIGFAMLDVDGVVERLNLAASEMMQTERQGAAGFPFFTYVDPEDRRAFLDVLTVCRRGTLPRDVVLTLVGRQRRRLTVQVHAKRIATDAADAILVALVDMTEQRRLEEARRRAEEEQRRLVHEEAVVRAANEAKDRFIAMLSHELRTPLTPVLLTLGTLARVGVPETMLPSLELIRRNVTLEARLIDDLLDVTRIARGKMRLDWDVVDVHAVVHDVLGLVADDVAGAGVEVALVLRAPSHHVRADATRLRQVVWNLARNAIQHTPSGGRVTIASANDAAGALVVTVADTGRGIPHELLGRVFEPFEQFGVPRSARGGLGLGLTIAKGIVEAHGGRIAVDSAGAGIGTVFTIAFVTVPAPGAAPAAPRRKSPRPRRVLLVEDDRDNAVAMAELLRVHGYAVHVADSVAGAIREAEKGFDVLVSDIGLPDGSGRDVIRELSAQRTVRGIALTGYGMHDDVEQNRIAGFALHLTKPVDPQQLIDAIEDVAS